MLRAGTVPLPAGGGADPQGNGHRDRDDQHRDDGDPGDIGNQIDSIQGTNPRVPANEPRGTTEFRHLRRDVECGDTDQHDTRISGPQLLVEHPQQHETRHPVDGGAKQVQAPTAANRAQMRLGARCLCRLRGLWG